MQMSDAGNTAIEGRLSEMGLYLGSAIPIAVGSSRFWRPGPSFQHRSWQGEVHSTRNVTAVPLPYSELRNQDESLCTDGLCL